MPSNCPHWNPGPGNYEPLSVYTGGKLEPGGDAPKTLFGRTDKLIAPMDRFLATVFLSNVRLRHICPLQAVLVGQMGFRAAIHAQKLL